MIHLFLLAEKRFLWAGELGSGEGKSGGAVNTQRGELAAHSFMQQAGFYPLSEQFSILWCTQGRSLGWFGSQGDKCHVLGHGWAGISSQGLIPRAKSHLRASGAGRDSAFLSESQKRPLGSSGPTFNISALAV